ncbi:hypothetical protein DFH09DRAFT_1327197 [Mycena vulgaris]|nr:hypothetical protein DFH09DRAFT_1327197 [Mycena vulgaris]
MSVTSVLPKYLHDALHLNNDRKRSEFDTEIPDEEAEKITTVQAAIDIFTNNQA